MAHQSLEKRIDSTNSSILTLLGQGSQDADAFSESTQDRSEEVIIIGLVLIALSSLVVAIRFTSRIRFGGGTKSDDWTVLFAWLMLVAFTVLTLICTANGFGKTVFIISPSNVLQLTKFYWASSFCYSLVLFFTKVSLILLYVRVFNQPGGLSALGIVLWTIGLISVGYILVVLIGTPFQCQVTSIIYDHGLANVCFKLKDFYIVTGALNLASDLGLVVCPLPAIVALRLPWKQRLGIYFTFSIGILVLVASSIRLVVLLRSTLDVDFLFAPSSAVVWSLVECNLAIIGASLPTTKSLIQRIFPKFLESKSYDVAEIDRNVEPAPAETFTTPRARSFSATCLPSVDSHQAYEILGKSLHTSGISKTVEFSVSGGPRDRQASSDDAW